MSSGECSIERAVLRPRCRISLEDSCGSAGPPGAVKDRGSGFGFVVVVVEVGGEAEGV